MAENSNALNSNGAKKVIDENLNALKRVIKPRKWMMPERPISAHWWYAGKVPTKGSIGIQIEKKKMFWIYGISEPVCWAEISFAMTIEDPHKIEQMIPRKIKGETESDQGCVRINVPEKPPISAMNLCLLKDSLSTKTAIRDEKIGARNPIA